MSVCTKKLFAWAGSMILFACLSFAMRTNDFTKANSVFDSRYKTEKNKMSSQKWGDASKKVEEKIFQSPKDASGLGSKRANIEDGGMGKVFGSKKSLQDGKLFSSPDLSGYDTTWQGADKTWLSDKKDVNFSKKYKGKIDFEKRGVYADYLKEAYSDMNERSMQDINKYEFRRSHSSEAGIKNIKAGSQLHGEEDDSSFLDILGGNKKIDREPVRLFGPKNRNAIPRQNANSSNLSIPSENIKRIGEIQNENILLPNSKIGSPIMKNSSGEIYRDTEANKTKKTKVAEREIDAEKAKNFRFLKMPDNMRGKAKIEVNVDNGDL